MTIAGPPPRPRPPASPRSVSRTREFVTPEGVDLRLRIGDAGERAAAFVLDMVILVASVVVFWIVTALAFMAFAMAAKINNAEVVEVIWLLGFFLLTNAYFVIFELTPGRPPPASGSWASGWRRATAGG